MSAATALPPALDRLFPQHLTDLQNSGLSDETITRWGCYSIEREQRGVLSQLGFGHIESSALALPIIPPDEDTPNQNNVMLKPDIPRRNGKGHFVKYEARRNSHNRIHAPLAARGKLSNASVPLIITEGQKKAEKAAQAGLCCVALSGVWNWNDRIGEASFPIADFDSIQLQNRRVYIAFDSDAANNAHLQAAERDLAGFLSKKREAHVLIKRLPPLPKWGQVWPR